MRQYSKRRHDFNWIQIGEEHNGVFCVSFSLKFAGAFFHRKGTLADKFLIVCTQHCSVLDWRSSSNYLVSIKLVCLSKGEKVYIIVMCLTKLSCVKISMSYSLVIETSQSLL